MRFEDRSRPGLDKWLAKVSAALGIGGVIGAVVAFVLADVANRPVGDTMAVGTAFGALLGGVVEWATRRRLPDEDEATAEWPQLRAQLRNLTLREWVVGERAPLGAVSAGALRLIDQPWSKNGRKAGTLTPVAISAIAGGSRLVAVTGDAGAGKSVVLWRLAEKLLRNEDPGSAPVVLELHRRRPGESIRRFAARELASALGGGEQTRRTVEAAVVAGRVHLLLDGLDEAGDPRECAVAIDVHRTFVRSASGVPHPMTFTCRSETYERLRPLPGNVDVEVRLMPLTPRQVDVLLDQSATACPGLREAVSIRPELRQLLARPLWWTVVTSVFQAGGPGPGLAGGEEHLMLRARLDQVLSSADERYEVEESRRHLAFLAGMLSDRHEAVLYPHEIQPGWLPPGGARLAADVVAGAMLWTATVLAGAVMLSLLPAPGRWPSAPILAALGVLGAAGTVAFVRSPAFAPKEGHRLSWRSARSRLPMTCLYAVASAVVAGCAFTYARGLAAGLIISLVVGVIAFLGSILEDVLDSNAVVATRSVEPFAALRSSWRRGLALTILPALLFAPAGLFAGGWGMALGTGLAGGSAGLYIYGLRHGLGGGIRYLSTIFVLALRGSLPWRLRPFLEYAARSGLLYPSGPGYRFLHRSLQDSLSIPPLPVRSEVTVDG